MENKTMVRRIILSDSCGGYDDLITFDKPVNFEDVEKVINKKKKELEETYTNEDMYSALDELGVGYKIIWLNGYEQVIY